MEQGVKRKAEDASGEGDKRQKTKKQWRTPRTGPQPKTIEPGDSGIWVSCARGKEGKCIGEVMDLFNEYAEQLYPDAVKKEVKDEDEDGEQDIEKAIQAEVNDMRKPGGASGVRLFTPIKINVQCVVFIKTVAPVEPVKLVKTICEDAMEHRARKRTRFAQRLSPMTLMGRASTEGLEKVAVEVLEPWFHQEPFQTRKFAIRPTLRNHNILSRDSVIKQVAPLVGPGHQVDLKNYELLIVVEVYQHICGVSVVDDSFERLKRFNISEIFDPTPKDV